MRIMTIDDAVCVRADVDIVDLSPPTNFVVAVDLDLYYFDIIAMIIHYVINLLKFLSNIMHAAFFCTGYSIRDIS